jgi:perosamine synthetase
MDPIIKASAKYGITVISDATESLGAEYRGRKLGQLADIACFSFNGNKIITTGSGGMIVTDREDLARRAKYLTTQAKDDPIEYVHKEIGYNYRLTNIQAAMGCAQLEQLPHYVAAKRRIAAVYLEALQDVPGVRPMAQADWALSTYWMFTVLVDKDKYGMDSRQLLERLGDMKIQARPLWQPMHLSPAHTGNHTILGSVAEGLNHDALSLPCSVGLSEADQMRVIDAIKGRVQR